MRARPCARSARDVIEDDLKRPSPDFDADSGAGTQSCSIERIAYRGEFYCIGDVVVGCHLQQLTRHPVGGVFEPLSGFGFDGRGVATVMRADATALNRRAPASVAVLAVRGATMRPDLGFGVGPPFFAPLDDRSWPRPS
jgi:hypothetical protein